MKVSSLLVLLLTLSFYTKAQEVVWKKQVSRVIDTRTDLNLDNSKNGSDSSIFRLIKTAVLSGKLVAYSRDDVNSFSKIPKQKLTDIFDYSVDSTTATDSQLVANRRVMYKGFYPDSAYLYRIIEDWSFNPGSGKVFIQIKYLAPLKNVYSADGQFRGTGAPLWIRYTDFYDMMQKANQERFLNHFLGCAWYSNFTCDASLKSPEPCSNTLKAFWQCSSLRTIDMQEPEDLAKHQLRSENADTLISEQIVKAIKNDVIPAWDGDTGFLAKPIAKKKLISLTTNILDTQTINDNGTPRPMVIQHDIIYANIHQYGINENWSFHPLSGTIRMEMTGIALLSDIYNTNGKPVGAKRMFWVCYQDIQPLLKKTEEYYPTNTFTMHVWNNFFLSDTRPKIENE